MQAFAVMRKESRVLFGVSLAVIGLTAGFLSYYRSHQKLGVPGVKVVPQAVLDPDGHLVGTNSVALPERVLDFGSRIEPVSKLVWEWLPKDTVYGQRVYQATNGSEVAVTVVLMGADRTSIHKPQYCLEANGWRITSQELTAIPIQEPHPYSLPVMKIAISRTMAVPGGGSVVRNGFFVYWFVADQELTATHKERMWWMSRDLLFHGVLQRWAYVSCLVHCAPGQEEAAYGRLREFVAAMVPQFQLTSGAPAALAENKLPGAPAGP